MGHDQLDSILGFYSIPGIDFFFPKSVLEYRIRILYSTQREKWPREGNRCGKASCLFTNGEGWSLAVLVKTTLGLSLRVASIPFAKVFISIYGHNEQFWMKSTLKGAYVYKCVEIYKPGPNLQPCLLRKPKPEASASAIGSQRRTCELKFELLTLMAPSEDSEFLSCLGGAAPPPALELPLLRERNLFHVLEQKLVRGLLYVCFRDRALLHLLRQGNSVNWELGQI